MSRYKWRDLLDINSPTASYLSPLACVAHIDVNAFFAQVEQIRCGYSREDPVVCVQWNSIIAVSYAAKKFGISRMDTVFDAFKKCDHLIPVHTAVFRKGEDFWQYHDDCGSWYTEETKKLSPEKHKVSLDPYRRESRKILKVFNEWCDLVEKASVDEVFLDLGRNVFSLLLFEGSFESLDGIRSQFKNGEYDLDDFLPAVPSALHIPIEAGDYNPKERPLLKDWDDVLFFLGSTVTKKIRDHIERELGYTTSCGIARTKTVAKLASNFKKPNAQTIIRNCNISDFLDYEGQELTSFWSMGGILGKELSKLLNLPNEGSLRYIRESWPVSSDDLAAHMKEKMRMLETSNNKVHGIDGEHVQQIAEKVFQLSRGDHRMSFNPRPVIKSMMSNKNLRGDSCKHYLDCLAWLEVFSGDLIGRIKEIEQEYERTVVPKTLTIMTKTRTFQRHTRRATLIVGGRVKAKDLMELGTRLVRELEANYGTKNDYYPLTGMAMSLSNFDIVETGKTIVDMFGQHNQVLRRNGSDFAKPDTETEPTVPDTEIKSFACDPCNQRFEDESSFKEHMDYHYAWKLSESLNGAQEDSKNLSYGERKLLFSKAKRAGSEAKARISKRPTQSKERDIYKYFTK